MNPHVAQTPQRRAPFDICSRVLLGLALATLTGCTPPKKSTPPIVVPPPPITLQQQIDLLNDRAHHIVGLRARGSVRITYLDDKNHTHSDDADGSMILRQTFDPQRTDVLLIGRYVGEDVFELGMNATVYWMAIRLDTKTAWIGERAHLDRPSNAPLRADRLVDLLALEPLDAAHATMLVHNDPDNVTNELFDLLVRPGDITVRRVITVDRFTGDITKVTLNQPDGTLLAEATLSDYQPLHAAATDDDAPPADARLRFPHRIHIRYPNAPGGHAAAVDLTLESAVLATPAEGKFALPNFAGQGLKIVPEAAGE
jgi:hypothetical protein